MTGIRPSGLITPRFPNPTPKYDRENEAQYRQAVERILRQVVGQTVSSSEGTIINTFFFDPDNTLDVGYYVDGTGVSDQRPAHVYAGTYMRAPRFLSDIATGTAPFTVVSTTKVANLDAHYLGAVNQDDAFFRNSSNQNAGTLPSGRLTGAYGGITGVGTLASGAVPASLVTAGTFGAGAYTFPSTLTVTTSEVIGTDPGGSSLLRIAASTTNGSFRFNGGGTIGPVGFNNDWLLQIYGIPGSSASAHPGTNTTTNGLGVAYTTPSTSTSASTQISTRITTAASAFTLGTAIGYYLQAPLVGAGSAITALYGMRVDNQGNAGVTTSYGLFVNSQSGSGTTYAIRTNNGQNLFGDITAIGATSPAVTQMLRIAGTHKDATDAGVIGFLVAVDPVAGVTTGNTQMWVQNRLGSNAITTAIALAVQATSNVAGTGTNVYGIQVANQGLAAITTSYGIQIADQTGSGTNYALYTGLGTVRLGGPVTAVAQITSTLATGTSPFAVTSTTVNTNLNADLLDGQHGTFYNDATNLTGTIASGRISGSYTGITGVGTLTVGTWNATAIDATHGGTAQTTWTLGDLLYGSGSNTLAKLAGNTTTTKKFLTQTGAAGPVSAAPVWDTLVAGDIPSLDASAIGSGTMATARLGSGSASATKFLRGDQTWAGAGYTLPVNAGAHNPTDATTYFFGLMPGNAGPAVSSGIGRVYINCAGTITRAFVQGMANTTGGTNEAWTLSIRLNNTTNTTIATVSTAPGTFGLREWINNSLSIAVAVGDYIEITMTTPTWATNPTGMVYMGVIGID